MDIKTDALFIADSHYNFKREALCELLSNIDNGSLKCSQLFLMGDIFDFLSNEISYFKIKNKELINLIQNISTKIEVFYFEGNHDFNLSRLFPQAFVIPRDHQPFSMKLDDKSVELSHGDIFAGETYDIFCKIIRNKVVLSLLNILDIQNLISKTTEKRLANKSICNKIKDFKYIVQKRIDNYKADIVIEGHYHEGKSYTFGKRKYINIPSLACDNEFIRYNETGFIKETI